MINIQYQPYVGLLENGLHVHTKFEEGKKLHFFRMNYGNTIHCDDFQQATVDDLKAGKIEGVTYLGYTELKECLTK